MAAEQTSGLTTYEWAVLLQKFGAQAAVPIRKGSKSVALPEWKEYQTRQPDASELFNWFEESDNGLGLILGPMLCAVDFDTDDDDGGWQSFSQQYPQFRNLPRSITGSGRTHVFFRPAKPFKKFILAWDGGNIEFRTGDNIIVMPPSVHPATGVLYEWAVPPLDGFPVVDIEQLGIRPPERRLSPVDLSFEEGEPLTDEEAGSIIDAVSTAWTEGNRHDLALALAGWCAGHSVPEDSARSIVDELAAGDDPLERVDRIRAVRDTYDAIRNGEPVRGWSALSGILTDDALDTLDHLMSRRPTVTISEVIANPHKIDIPYIINIGDFLALDLPQPTYLVQDMLVEATVQLMIGPPKTFKTFLDTELHLSIASGTPAFGVFDVPTPRTTCYIQREMGPSLWQDRLRRMILGRGLEVADVASRMLLITGHDVRVDDADHMRRLTDSLLTQHEDLALITLDTFKKSHSANENDNTEMDAVMDVLLRIRDEFNIAIQLVHHTSKAQEATSFEQAMRGAVVMWGSSDDGIWLSRIKDPEGEENIKKIKVSFDGRNIAQTEPFGYRLVDRPNGGIVCEMFPLGDTSDRRKSADDKIVEWLDTNAGWHDLSAIQKAMGWKPTSSQASVCAKRLAEAGLIRKKGNRPSLYASAKFPVQDDLDF